MVMIERLLQPGPLSHLRSSQRSAADHIADHLKLRGCKLGRLNRFCGAVK
jgi:hypothetical protein